MFINYQTANLAKGRLKAGISASAWSIILDTNQWDLFPSTYPYLLKIEKYDTSSSLEIKPVLKREIVEVSNKSWDTFTITRSAGYCPESDTATTQTNTAFAFDSWDWVYLVDSKERHDDVANEIIRLENDKANDSEVVHNTGDENVDWVKTFSEFPIVPVTAPTADNEVVNKKYVDDEVISAQQTDELIDDSFMLWEPVLAGQCVFLETWPVTWVATTKQNIGDVAGNTRVSFPVIWTGIQSDTFKVNLCKTGSTHPSNQGLYFRIETDNAGSPSWVLVNPNAIAHILPADLTTSLADTTMTLAGSITIPEWQKCYLVAFQSTSDDYADTVIDTDYYNIWYSTNNTTTRWLSLYSWTAWGTSTTYVWAHWQSRTTDASNANPSPKTGIAFTVWVNSYLSSTIKNSYWNIDRCQLYDNNWNLIETATVVWDTATFSWTTQLLVGNTYYMMWDKSWATISFKAIGSVSFPITNNNITYTGGVTYNSSTWRSNNSVISAVISITTITYAPSFVAKRCYISSTLFQNQLLSLTDSDFAYKVDLQGIAIESKWVGTYPKLTIQGINGEQTGLANWYVYYLSWTPWNISATPWTNIVDVWYPIDNNKLMLRDNNLFVAWTSDIILRNDDIVLSSLTNTPYTKVKEILINKWWTYNVYFQHWFITDWWWSGSAVVYSRIYKNGSALWTERATTWWDANYTESLVFAAWDLLQLYTKSGRSNASVVKNRNLRILWTKLFNCKNLWINNM
jgi:hypothetical protein